jgi:hypothetical protein
MSGILGNIKTNIAHKLLKDLKSLNDILVSEKSVLNSWVSQLFGTPQCTYPIQSTVRLSVETRKASDFLREWGKLEGDDLGVGHSIVAISRVVLRYKPRLSFIGRFEQTIHSPRSTRNSTESICRTPCQLSPVL